MPYRKASTTNPLETQMRQVREDIETLQLEIEATIGELKETLYTLRELTHLDLGARLERVDRKQGKKPN